MSVCFPPFFVLLLCHDDYLTVMLHVLLYSVIPVSKYLIRDQQLMSSFPSVEESVDDAIQKAARLLFAADALIILVGRQKNSVYGVLCTWSATIGEETHHSMDFIY